MEVTENDWRQALGSGRFDEAERLYLIGGGDDPVLKRALATLGEVMALVREKRWASARRRLQRLEEKPPLLDWEELGAELELLEGVSTSIQEGGPQGDVGRLEDGRLHWFNAEAANQRGTARVYGGEFALARQDFEEAVSLDPKHYRALTNLGNAWLEEGDVDRAIECYERALKINEDFANAHHNLGVAYRRQGQVGKSVRHLRRAQRVRHRTDSERERENLGTGSAKSGLKVLRWTLYGLGAVALYAILRSQGLL